MSTNLKCTETHATDSMARTELPAALVCKRTGEPAGLDDECPCDACRWMRLAEADFRANEWEEDDRDA